MNSESPEEQSESQKEQARITEIVAICLHFEKRVTSAYQTSIQAIENDWSVAKYRNWVIHQIESQQVSLPGPWSADTLAG